MSAFCRKKLYHAVFWFHYHWWGSEQAALKCATLAFKLFWAENSQGPKNSRGTFDLPPYCLKEFKTGGLSQEGAIITDYHSNVLGVVGREGPSKVLSVSHCLRMAQQTFVYQTLALFIFLWITSLPLEASDTHLLLLSPEYIHQYLTLPCCLWNSSYLHMDSLGASSKFDFLLLICLV